MIVLKLNSVWLTMVILCSACSRTSDTITLAATEDFPVLEVQGFAAYSRSQRKGRNVLQVDADRTGYQFAAAQTVFTGPAGRYDVTIYTLGDEDGVCQYRFQLNDKPVAPQFAQPAAEEKVMEHTWPDVSIARGDVIQIMSNGSDSALHGGGAGPRGFHMAHGRWLKVEFHTLPPR